VTSLNGEAEQGVVVEAVGQNDCIKYQEESKTEQDGSYRIRGLQVCCNSCLPKSTGWRITHPYRLVWYVPDQGMDCTILDT